MRHLPLLLMTVILAALVSCATGEKIAEEIQSEKQRLSVDEKRGARVCVPYDLAMARVALASAQMELEAGNYHIAEDLLLKEKKYAANTAKYADSCIPKDKDEDGVPDDADKCPLQPGPAKYDGCPDSDGDGVLDLDDKCPSVPGLRERQGCPDAADSDGDGIPDNKDRCPFDAEDMDGFEDKDGCPDTDNDKDGVLDDIDKCRDQAGPASNQGCPFHDKDGDGIPDEMDKCPTEPEDGDGFEDQDGCPEADNDKDGLCDENPVIQKSVDKFKSICTGADKCPNDPGPRENHGCPVLDGDGDGVPDVIDKCPAEAGPMTNQGCPVNDRDGDGIVDKDDKCPDEPGPIEEQGCPKKYKLIVVTAQKIELKQTVFFKTGKAVIDGKSYPMLKEVADAIKSVPSIKKVLIEGHTDNVGGRNLNIKLSQSRADSVREFLIDEGVDGSKLEATGYGPDKPISPNKTEKGRAMNRRVEFNIVQ